MNTESTKHGPYEGGSLTRDWLRESKRERDFTYGIALGSAAFAAALWGVATFGYVHPLLAHLAAYLGVK